MDHSEIRLRGDDFYQALCAVAGQFGYGRFYIKEIIEQSEGGQVISVEMCARELEESEDFTQQPYYSSFKYLFEKANLDSPFYHYTIYALYFLSMIITFTDAISNGLRGSHFFYFLIFILWAAALSLAKKKPLIVNKQIDR
ncbi:MAG: hypothetical protein HQL32_14355 [Planctomycetes bacterium]|nr:hypothetical protein [Planctomycetota bacterium]